MSVAGASKRVLDPIDRISEILFGLIMVLTFTGSLSVAEAGRGDVREMLVGALGCNLAWGIIDGLFYLMGCLGETGRDLLRLRALRDAADPAEAHRALAEALPPAVASVMRPEDFATLSARLKALPAPPDRARLGADHWLGAVAVFVLVFLSTFPVTIPFLFMTNLPLAMRVSNAIAIVMLFGAGHAFGRMTGRRPVRMGVGMVLLGAVLVSITIALGG